MNQTDKILPTKSQVELLNFMNPVDAKSIAKSLNNVMCMAIFETSNPITEDIKDDLFLLRKLIIYAENISEE